MDLHEKSLELNITHELLSLSDSWYWFLTDIPLWRYWRPRNRLPFFKYPKSTAGGFHINTEGKNDPTGTKGGGFDVRIKSGANGHLLFIQYKLGELVTASPHPTSEFEKKPHDHFSFKINSTRTNQHFALRNLANGAGANHGNAVVYAFPLISDMNDLEANAGKLIRKTKFISIADIDAQAISNKVSFTLGKEHKFRVGKFDMNRCEVNYYYYYFTGPDRTNEVITDLIALRFQRISYEFLNIIEKNYEDYGLDLGYLPLGIRQSFGQYIRFLLHYFEVNPSSIQNSNLKEYLDGLPLQEFQGYSSEQRDVEILSSIFKALEPFGAYFSSFSVRLNRIGINELPDYYPTFFIPIGKEGITIEFGDEFLPESLDDIGYVFV
jgi:hypothetical protein